MYYSADFFSQPLSFIIIWYQKNVSFKQSKNAYIFTLPHFYLPNPVSYSDGNRYQLKLCVCNPWKIVKQYRTQQIKKECNSNHWAFSYSIFKNIFITICFMHCKNAFQHNYRVNIVILHWDKIMPCNYKEHLKLFLKKIKGRSIMFSFNPLSWHLVPITYFY